MERQADRRLTQLGADGIWQRGARQGGHNADVLSEAIVLELVIHSLQFCEFSSCGHWLYASFRPNNNYRRILRMSSTAMLTFQTAGGL